MFQGRFVVEPVKSSLLSLLGNGRPLQIIPSPQWRPRGARLYLTTVRIHYVSRQIVTSRRLSPLPLSAGVSAVVGGGEDVPRGSGHPYSPPAIVAVGHNLCHQNHFNENGFQYCLIQVPYRIISKSYE